MIKKIKSIYINENSKDYFITQIKEPSLQILCKELTTVFILESANHRNVRLIHGSDLQRGDVDFHEDTSVISKLFYSDSSIWVPTTKYLHQIVTILMITNHCFCLILTLTVTKVLILRMEDEKHLRLPFFLQSMEFFLVAEASTVASF